MGCPASSGWAGFPELTYHSVKQLSSDAAAPLRLLKLSSVSKLIPRPLLSPGAPESAVQKKKGALGDLKTHIWLHWLSSQHSNLSKHFERSTIPILLELSTIQVINDFLPSVVNTYS